MVRKCSEISHTPIHFILQLFEGCRESTAHTLVSDIITFIEKGEGAWG